MFSDSLESILRFLAKSEDDNYIYHNHKGDRHQKNLDQIAGQLYDVLL